MIVMPIGSFFLESGRAHQPTQFYLKTDVKVVVVLYIVFVWIQTPTGFLPVNSEAVL